MAIARLSMKVGKTGSSCPHAAYIARAGRYAHRLEQGEKLEAVEAGNLPAWAQHDSLLFWQAADAHERSNGTTYREMEIALPRELDASQRIALVRSFVVQEIGDKHAYQWAIHTPLAADGQAQPHLHLMFSERQVDGIERDPEQYFKRYNARNPEKGGARKGYGPHAGHTLTRAERAVDLKELRGRWQEMANKHLEQLGHSARIDMRSHAERGTGLVPEMKQLPSQWRGEGRENVIEFRQARTEQVQATVLVCQIVPNAPAEIISLEAERQQRAQTQQEKTKQQRIEGLNSGGIRLEIERLRPPDVKEVVDSHPEVQALQQAHAALYGKLEQAQAVAAMAQQAIAAWREAHPLRSKAHDLGLVQSGYLTRYEQAGRQARDKALILASRVNAVGQRVRQMESRVEARTVEMQKPARDQVARLERVWQRKIGQELNAQRQAKKLERAISGFKDHAIGRALKIHGYSDTGRQWKALSESMRKTIDDFNRLPKEKQSVALAKMREDLRFHPDRVEKLAQQLELGKVMGWGRGG